MNYTSNHSNEIPSYDMLVELYNELDNFSAKDLFDGILSMKKRKQREIYHNGPYGSYEEMKVLSDEASTLQDMFVCANRYLYTMFQTGEMTNETFQNTVEKIRHLHDVYCCRLDTYSKQRFGMYVSQLRFELLTKSIEKDENINKPLFTHYVNDIIYFDFYIPAKLSTKEVRREINKRTLEFCRVLFTWFMHKGPHSYVHSLEFAVISRVTIICMLAARIECRNADIWEIEDCINDFTKLAAYIRLIELHFSINIDVTGASDSGKDNYYYSILLYVKSHLLSSPSERLEIYKSTHELRVALSELASLKDKILSVTT